MGFQETELVFECCFYPTSVHGGKVELEYSKMKEIDAGIKLKTISGIEVETTGSTLFVDAAELFVHEVVITDGVGEGNKYLHNLDSCEALEA